VLAARNIVAPGGSLETNGRNLIVLPSGEFRSEKDVGNVIIGKSATGTPLYLRDPRNDHERLSGSCAIS